MTPDTDTMSLFEKIKSDASATFFTNYRDSPDLSEAELIVGSFRDALHRWLGPMAPIGIHVLVRRDKDVTLRRLAEPGA